MHFNGRPEQKKIVLNSFQHGKWEKELYIDWPAFGVGQSFIIVVTVLHNGYKFKINKIEPQVIFPHRIPFNNVRKVNFGGPAGTWTSFTRST